MEQDLEVPEGPEVPKDPEEPEDPKNVTPYSTLYDKPEVLLGFVDKFVKLELVKNHSYSGFVHSIDPVSHSIIMSVPIEDTFQITLFPGFSITDITQVEPETTIKPPSRKKPSKEIPIEEIIKKKKQVIAWIQHNLLPVTEAGNNIVVGSASILPPYTATDICTENPVIHLQLKDLIVSMPKDYEPK